MLHYRKQAGVVTGLLLCILCFPLMAGKDTYPQAIYDCEVKPAKDKNKSLLTVKVRNRSKHISIYGFMVDARYLDCKLPEIKKDEYFISRACREASIARLSVGSMARPPRDDVKVPPGQTRTYEYRFRYPGKPDHKKYRIDLCKTYSTATFTAAEAPEVFGLIQKEEEEPGMWQRWWTRIKSWFD